MGVLTLQLLVCGQLILYSLVLINITDAQQSSVSLFNVTPVKKIAPPLNATGNHTENNVSDSTSYSGYNHNTTARNNLTTPATTAGFNSTLGPNLSNVTGSAGQPNETETSQTTQPATSSPSNITSTTVTSTANTTHSSNGSATTSTTPMTKPTAVTSTAITQNSTTSFNESQAGGGMNHSEKSLTVLFSVLLGVIVLVILVHFMYKFRRSKERSIQYTHRRLHNEDTGESFAVPDDTLVISGGLYDGPQIYNPTMTVQNEDFQTDTSGFASRPTQFHLEFLREDQDREVDHETSTFETFHAHDQEP